MANHPCGKCGSVVWWWSDGDRCSKCDLTFALMNIHTEPTMPRDEIRFEASVFVPVATLRCNHPRALGVITGIASDDDA